MTSSRWSDNDLTTLSKMVGEGAGARAVAEAVKRSEWAVRDQAKKQRLHFAGRRPPPPALAAVKPAAPRYTPPAPRVVPEVECNPVPIGLVRRGQCRFVVAGEGTAESLVCANPAEPGSNHCAPHRAYMTRPTSSVESFVRSLARYY